VWRLDVSSELTAVVDVSLGSPGSNGAAGSGYGGFFWRLPPCSGARIFTSDAEGEPAVHGSVAPWLAWTASFGEVPGIRSGRRPDKRSPMPNPETSYPAPAWNSRPGLAFGGDYNPEQWPADVRLEDIGLMKEAGVTLLSVAIFSWALLEPREGEYDFAWLDEVLDNLDGAGIKVALATATAAPPAWLVRKHPEVLPVTADGTVLERGSRRHYSPSSAVYRRYATGITRCWPNGTRTIRPWRSGTWTMSWAATFQSFTARRTPPRSGAGWSSGTAASKP
jgi:hypothetical protein